MHHHGLPHEELVCHGQVLLQEEGGEEEEAQGAFLPEEVEADDPRPAAQGQQASLDRDSSRDWNLGLTSWVLAASCWQCCTSGLNTARNVAKTIFQLPCKVERK